MDAELKELLAIEKQRLDVSREEVRVAKIRAEADLIAAQEQKKRNELDRWQLTQQAHRLATADRLNEQVEEALMWMRQVRDGHHEPIMLSLSGISEKIGALVQILNIAFPALLRGVAENDREAVDQALSMIHGLMNAKQGSQIINVGSTSTTHVTAGKDVNTHDMTGGSKYE